MKKPSHDLDDHEWLGAEYYTLTEAAALLRISPRTLLRWVKSDISIPIVRVHGTALFPAAGLRGWLKNQQEIEHERRLQKKGVRQ
jgi:excisionase family DNA binding protein